MLGGQLLQLGDELSVPAEREIGVDARLESSEAELVQPGGDRRDEFVAGQVS
jgi:hypothetical protein